MPNPKYAAYRPAAPYFGLIRETLGALVDGEHFFDIVTDDIIYEVPLRRPRLAPRHNGADRSNARVQKLR
jgi:hypothetical protein